MVGALRRETCVLARRRQLAFALYTRRHRVRRVWLLLQRARERDNQAV